MNDVTIHKANEKGVPDRPLVRHLAVIVTLKLVFLFLLWFLFFRLPEGAPEPGFDIQNHIAGSNAAVSTQKEVKP